MTRNFELHALWGARREDIDGSADRCVGFMRSLSEVDEAFRTLGWADYDHGAAFRQLPLTRDALRERLLLGRQWTDDDEPRLIEDFGFSAELIDAAVPNERMRISIRCGAYAKGSRNAVQANLGGWSAKTTQLALLAAFERTMEVWGAERGVVLVDGLHKLFPYVAGSLLMGSCLWLPAAPRELPPLPSGARVEARGDRSSLIVVTRELFDLDDPAHVDAARATHAALSGAGLLKL